MHGVAPAGLLFCEFNSKRPKQLCKIKLAYYHFLVQYYLHFKGDSHCETTLLPVFLKTSFVFIRVPGVIYKFSLLFIVSDNTIAIITSKCKTCCML